MPAMDNLRASKDAYITKVDAWIAAANQNQQTSDQLVAAALAAQQAGNEVDLQKLSDDLQAAASRVPDPPVAPPA